MRYVTGSMTGPEREGFEVLMEFDAELQAHVASLQAVEASLVLTRMAPTPPPTMLKSRLLATLGGRGRPPEPEALVVTTPDGTFEWVNPAFTALCGHALAEIKGRRPSQVLQGPETDSGTVERIRTAVRERRPCRERLINYHKDGSRYVVDVAITPILDDDGRPLWFVARERRVATA